MNRFSKRVLSSVLALLMVVMSFPVMSFAYTGTAPSSYGFEDYSGINGAKPSGLSMGGLGANVTQSDIDNGYYTYGAEKGMFGKDASDTSFRFTSELNLSALPSGTSSNPLIQRPIGIKSLTSTDVLHISFELARTGCELGGYVQIRPVDGNGADNVNHCFKEGQGIDWSSGILSIYGVSVNDNAAMAQDVFNKFDLFYYPSYSGNSTAVDAYLNGVKVLDKKILTLTTEPMTGISHVRVAFDPKPIGGVYPKTSTYADNFYANVVTASTIPTIYAGTIKHSDVTLNALIDNTKRTITNQGQTAGEMLNGLSSTNNEDFTFKFINDITKKELASTDSLEGAMLVMSSAGGTYYYTVKQLSGFIKNSDYIVNKTAMTISGVFPYSTSSYFMGKITTYSGTTVKVVNADNSAVANTDYIKTGMKLQVKLDSTVEEYTITVNEDKYIDLSFDDWNAKIGYASDTQSGLTAYNGYGLSGPTTENIDTVYMDFIPVAGRGKVMHVYSNAQNTEDTASYRHYNLTKSSFDPSMIGKRFIMETSMMIDNDGATSATQGKYKKKSNGTISFINPLNFTGGKIMVFDQYVGNYELNKWYDIKAYIDTETGTGTIFVNGVNVYSGAISILNDFDAFTEIRLVQHYMLKGVERNTYIDDFRLYGVGSLSDDFIASMDTTLNSDTYVVSGATINGYKNMTVAEIMADAKIADGASSVMYNEDGVTLANTAAKAAKGMMLRVTSKDGKSFKNYVLDVEQGTIGNIEIKINGLVTANKFAAGTVEATADYMCYADTMDVAMIIAQYDKTGHMIGSKIAKTAASGTGKITASYNVTKTTDTTIKAMLWNNTSDILAYSKPVELTPYSDDEIQTVTKLYPGYTTKAVTFSFDDGNAQDTKLIDLFKKYGLRGTFNLISNRFTTETLREQFRDRYAGKDYVEIANHSYSHPRMYLTAPETINGVLTQPMTYDECISNITRGDTDIKATFGFDVVKGFAWPYNMANGRSDYAEMLADMQALGIKYARPSTTNGSFANPSNWMEWKMTTHHDGMKVYTDQFINLPNSGELKTYSVWGHTYELEDTYKPEETGKLRWSTIEPYFAKLAAATDIWKATNVEVCEYVQALDSLSLNAANTKLINNSDVTLYVQINGQNVVVPAHGEAGL